VKPDDLAYLNRIGIQIDTSILYGSSLEELVEYTRNKLRSVISEIERNAKEFRLLGEDGLSSLIATALNNTMVLVAQREENSRGHVDLTITAPVYSSEDKYRYLGEAKVWSTKQYCIDGFEQLMGYITGRQKNAFTIIYFRILECDERFKSYLEELLQQKGGKKIKLENRYGLTRHTHISTAEVEIDHFAAHAPKN
jgi:hypothetical protein